MIEAFESVCHWLTDWLFPFFRYGHGSSGGGATGARTPQPKGGQISTNRSQFGKGGRNKVLFLVVGPLRG